MTIMYQTYQVGEAHFKLYMTHNAAEADLWVFLSKNRGAANRPGVWYLSKYKEKSQYKIYFSTKGMSELIIYSVNNISQAGWKKEHKLRIKKL